VAVSVGDGVGEAVGVCVMVGVSVSAAGVAVAGTLVSRVAQPVSVSQKTKRHIFLSMVLLSHFGVRI
jgi:hypothetical protein